MVFWWRQQLLGSAYRVFANDDLYIGQCHLFLVIYQLHEFDGQILLRDLLARELSANNKTWIYNENPLTAEILWSLLRS